MDPNARAERRPHGLLVAAAIETFTAVYVAIATPNTLSSFENLFKGFTWPIPAATKFLLAVPWIGWPFASTALALLMWIARSPRPTETERRRMTRALWAFAMVFGAAAAWAIIALYTPMIDIGPAA